MGKQKDGYEDEKKKNDNKIKIKKKEAKFF